MTAPPLQGPYCAPVPIVHNKLPQAWCLNSQCLLCSLWFLSGLRRYSGRRGGSKAGEGSSLGAGFTRSLVPHASGHRCWLSAGTPAGAVGRSTCTWPVHVAAWLPPGMVAECQGRLPGEERRSECVMCLQRGITSSVPHWWRQHEVCPGSRSGDTGQTMG